MPRSSCRTSAENTLGFLRVRLLVDGPARGSGVDVTVSFHVPPPSGFMTEEGVSAWCSGSVGFRNAVRSRKDSAVPVLLVLVFGVGVAMTWWSVVPAPRGPRRGPR